MFGSQVLCYALYCGCFVCHNICLRMEASLEHGSKIQTPGRTKQYHNTQNFALRKKGTFNLTFFVLW